MASDDVIERWRALTIGERRVLRVKVEQLGDTLASELAAARERIAELETALSDALDGMLDMRPYVDEYFAEKWSHDAYIDRARAALGDSDGE